MNRIFAGLLLAVCTAMAAAPAAAQVPTAPIEAFYGRFTGGGIASNDDSLYFAVSARDFDVVITAAPKGFRIDWTSVIRRGGVKSKPRVHRKSASKVFVRTANPNVFHGSKEGDPLKGGELSWARIEQQTLSVFLMTIDEDGVYELQQYDRTLAGAGMELVFKSYRDGDRLRMVKGKLVKIGR